MSAGSPERVGSEASECDMLGNATSELGCPADGAEDPLDCCLLGMLSRRRVPLMPVEQVLKYLNQCSHGLALRADINPQVA